MAELPFVDQPREVRDGEALDLPALDAFIAEHLDLAGPITVQQFPGGHSNLTYMVRKGERELVLRRPPFGGERIKTAHDMGREYRILSGLVDVYPRVPRPLAMCEDDTVLGAPFYLMERKAGIILRGQRPPKGLSLPEEMMRTISTTLIELLAELHAVDLEGAGLAGEGRPEGYVERQVVGWIKRYFNAKTDEVSQVEQVATWLEENRPTKESGAALVHGDFKYDNLVLDPRDISRVVAILDWEMATVGDPLMDLGTTLGYWIDPDDPMEHKMLPLGPTLLPGNLTRPELVERYAQRGRDPEGILFYYVFGLFKILVIAQQIYRRFKDGLTQDPRFGSMIMGVQILGRTAATALDRDRIHALG